MKRASREAPLRRPGDSPQMRQAVDWCEAAFGARLKRPTQHQLKVPGFSYYPNTEVIQPDGEKGLAERGLEGLARVLKARLPKGAQLPPLPKKAAGSDSAAKKQAAIEIP